MDTKNGGRLVGRAVHVHGRQTNVKLLDGHFEDNVRRIRVVGREEVSLAESSRDIFLMRLLREDVTLHDRPLVNMLWFSQAPLTRSVSAEAVMPTHAFSRLNSSQCKVAAAMISTSERSVIAQGRLDNIARYSEAG